MPAGPPSQPRPVPTAVADFAAGRPVVAVWENELGGLTFRVGGDPAASFVKWAPAGAGLDLDAERTRLAWLAGRAAVPVLLASGSEETGQWLATAPLPGRSAVDPRWLAEPAVAVSAIARGLRRLHDELDPAQCPFSWSVSTRLGPRPPSDPVQALVDAPAIERLVVCHGDPCAPNTLLDEAGRFLGHVDLGALGLADRWADLAVASWSLDWNYGSGWAATFFAAYGVSPDPLRIDYYRRLWTLT